MDPRRNPHLARMSPHFAYVEANVRDRNPNSARTGQSAGASMLFEIPRATAALLSDPRQGGKTVYLSAFKCANDEPALARLLDHLAGAMNRSGSKRLVGPIGLSAHVNSGVLTDHWDQWPPWHTVYNPPYLPEIMDNAMRPLAQKRLYNLNVPEEPISSAATKATLQPLTVEQLAGPLLALFNEATTYSSVFPPLDSVEARFLLRWLGLETLFGWKAEVNDVPAGFILLQPDLGPLMRLASGGRYPWWRLWLQVKMRRPVRQGRLLFGAVDPVWQRQGIGRQLLLHALNKSRYLGWQSISAGPVPEGSQAAKLFAGLGGRARQSYQLYELVL